MSGYKHTHVLVCMCIHNSSVNRLFVQRSRPFRFLKYLQWNINILWRIGPLLGNARNTHAANNTGTVFCVVRAPTVAMQRTLNTFSRTQWRHTTIERLCFCCGPCRVVVEDNRKGVFYVVRAMPSAVQRANRHAFWHMTYVFCAAWSMPRLHKEASLKDRERVRRMGIQRRKTEYNREYENEKSVRLSVGDSYGKLVVEEELEVSLWRLSVWLQI
jgi:hypothetical protein